MAENSTPVSITQLEIQNVKRIKAVNIDCSGIALTVIGGRNGEGKTSVLGAICYALGGKRFSPTMLKRDGSIADPTIKITLSNGIVVERKGKNSALKVIDASGRKAGQHLLNSFINQFALDLPKFMASSATEKKRTLLQVIGVGDQLKKLEDEEKVLYDTRHFIGQNASRLEKHAESLEYFPDEPAELISVSELIQKQQTILAQNGENQRLRLSLQQLKAARDVKQDELTSLLAQVESVRGEIYGYDTKIASADKTVAELKDACTSELEASIRNVEEANAKIATNIAKEKAASDAKKERTKYEDATAQLDAVRKQIMELLNNADLPLPGLSVTDGYLTFKGQQWDCMSSAEQLIVAVSITRRLSPQCGFVLIDRLESMDVDTLQAFGSWLAAEKLQAIATRVSTGDECSIIIEDGTGIAPVNKRQFSKGEF